MSEKTDRTIQDCLNRVIEHAESLCKERHTRPLFRHANDHRIPEEIVRDIYQLGLWRKELTEAIERSQLWIGSAQIQLNGIREVQNQMQKELEIATNQDLE